MMRDMWHVLSGSHRATCQVVSKLNNESSNGTQMGPM